MRQHFFRAINFVITESGINFIGCHKLTYRIGSVYLRGVIGLCLALALGAIISPVYGVHYISFQNTVDVKKEFLLKALTDYNNYPKVFPDNIKSATVSNNFVHIDGKAGPITFNEDATYAIQTDGSYTLEIISGDLKGTKITSWFTDTWGFDGTPNGGTIVRTNLSLETSGLASFALLFVSDKDIQSAMGTAIHKFSLYAMKIQDAEPPVREASSTQPVTLPSQSQSSSSLKQALPQTQTFPQSHFQVLGVSKVRPPYYFYVEPLFNPYNAEIGAAMQQWHIANPDSVEFRQVSNIYPTLNLYIILTGNCIGNYSGVYSARDRLIIICTENNHTHFDTNTIYEIALHEIGHALGFPHDNGTDIMNPKLIGLSYDNCHIDRYNEIYLNETCNGVRQNSEAVVPIDNEISDAEITHDKETLCATSHGGCVLGGHLAPLGDMTQWKEDVSKLLNGIGGK